VVEHFHVFYFLLVVLVCLGDLSQLVVVVLCQRALRHQPIHKCKVTRFLVGRPQMLVFKLLNHLLQRFLRVQSVAGFVRNRLRMLNKATIVHIDVWLALLLNVDGTLGVEVSLALSFTDIIVRFSHQVTLIRIMSAILQI